MRCVITEVKDNKAVLLNEFGEFMTVASKNYQVGQKVEYKKQSLSQYKYIAACVIMLILVSLSSYAYYFTPVSYASVDINPSLQLGINRFDKVVSIQPLNDDAKALLETISIKNEDITQSVDKIIEASKEMGYLSEENNHVEVDIVTKNDKLMDRVNNHMDNYKEDPKYDFTVEQADNDDLKLAKDLNLSVGKTKAIKKYTETFGGDLNQNASQLSTMTVGDIKKTIRSKVENYIENKNKSGNNLKGNQSHIKNEEKENKTENNNNGKLNKVDKTKEIQQNINEIKDGENSQKIESKNIEEKVENREKILDKVNDRLKTIVKKAEKATNQNNNDPIENKEKEKGKK